MASIEAKYVAHMGDDLMVVNAARVSFAKQSEWESIDIEIADENSGRLWIATQQQLSDRDQKLIGYLARHGHWTPFGHPQITLHIKAPIFVRTQCFKHKVGFVENEVSRRYVDDEPEFYTPKVWRARADNKKQGSADALGVNSSMKSEGVTSTAWSYARHAYSELLARGVAPEQARMVLPQATMTEWYWTGSLAAWARFYKQRTDEHAQAETGDVARVAGSIIAPLFPVSWVALVA